jgi:anti-anti-sigma factor
MPSSDPPPVVDGPSLGGPSRNGVHATGPITTVPLAGEFDMAREAELVAAVVTLDLAASSVVRLDMSQVTFVDSAGLRGILKAQAYLNGRGCQLELLRPNAQMVRVIEITGLGDVVAVADERR